LGFEEHKKHSHGTMNCAVITVSTTRTKESDTSGRAIVNLLEVKGNTVLHYHIVKDDISKIRMAMDDIMKNESVQAIILNGGTGISKKDVTIEAVAPILEKELPGFGELFRYLSYKEIGTPALLSRAIGGVGRGRIIFCLPGSTNACKLAMERLILPELGHMAYEALR
jgi:molybdenum cofactor biosynthesis protein B